MANNKHDIFIFKYDRKGKLQDTYSPLQNLIIDDELRPFKTTKLNYDLSNYVDIDTQLSYDDSINIVLNNNNESPRIINSQFRVLGNNTYEYLTRNHGCSTNLYSEESLKQTSDLFLRSSKWPIIDLKNVEDSGMLMGGNYTFYIKYCDEDFNESEIVSESGIVSIFSGSNPSNASGVILDSETTKNIKLHIRNLDPSFDKFFIYFSRDTCDLNGINITKYYKIDEPYIVSENVNININGYEKIIEIGQDQLFITYNYFSSAKTQAIVQNMLFVGNLKTAERNYPKLQQLSYRISTTLRQKNDSIGYINNDYSINWSGNSSEYYDPLNIYYNLGYWPDEYYKLAVCYILSDGTTTEAFPLYGGKLTLNKGHKNDILDDIEINKLFNNLNNSGGIFKLPKVEIINHETQEVKPLYFEFNIDSSTIKELQRLDVIGAFFVRAKRTPISLFQGLSVGVDTNSGVIMPYVSDGAIKGFVVESFLSESTRDEADRETLKGEDYSTAELSNDIISHLRSCELSEYSALISLDATLNYELRNLLSWSKFQLNEEYECNIGLREKSRLYRIGSYKIPDIKHDLKTELMFIDENIPSVYIDNKYFSTRAGNAESASEFVFFYYENTDSQALNLLRGIYTPIIGSNTNLKNSSIYTVKLNINSDEDWVTSLLNNTSIYYSITNRYTLDEVKNIEAYRGDCFVNTVTIRLNRNFIDPTFPSNDNIVDKYTWENYRGYNKMKTLSDNPDNKNIDYSYGMINLGDLNTVQLGQWITFKCLSNYNLGLRSIDTRDVVNIGKLGSKGKSFYPISGCNTLSNNKLGDSHLLNEGYNITLSRKAYNKWTPTPFENWNFENRIAFSNIASTKMFTNGFRIFQGLAYQDVDKSFGSIVKLFPYAQNLLCVFEHGLAIVPINEKALLSTQEGLSIHLYGAGVLQEQVSVISPDYGSTWIESIIKTPDAYYGVDTHAKKIWKYNNTEGFQCISDFKIQSFLNDNLNVTFNDNYYLGATSVRTHYNNFKGDVIFTFYNKENAYSVCYNERMKMWTSRYSWLPLLSENIDNHFYSFDREIVNKYTNVWKHTLKEHGIICKHPTYNSNGIELEYNGLFINDVTLQVSKIKFENIDHTWGSVNDFELITNKEGVQGLYFNTNLLNYDIDYGIITNISKFNRYINKPLHCEKSDWSWSLIQDNESSDIIFETIEPTKDKYAQNVSLCRINSKHLVNTEVTSGIPISIFEGDENLLENYEFYLTYITKTYSVDKNTHKLFIPNTSEYGTVTITIDAVYKDKVIETHTFPISYDDFHNTNLTLYKHDISSKICNWYGTQHGFEYEFVVNQPAGLHKIFNNLMIISNNVEPDSLEVEIVGDSYDFKEEFISQNKNIKYKFPIISLPDNKTYQTKLTLDKVTNEWRLLMHQDCLNIKDFGRRLGNISYIEGKWYVVLQPIYYEDKTLKTTRLRDKWAKIRIKYSGKKLAIITAIQTLMNISYA